MHIPKDVMVQNTSCGSSMLFRPPSSNHSPLFSLSLFLECSFLSLLLGSQGVTEDCFSIIFIPHHRCADETVERRAMWQKPRRCASRGENEVAQFCPWNSIEHPRSQGRRNLNYHFTPSRIFSSPGNLIPALVWATTNTVFLSPCLAHSMSQHPKPASVSLQSISFPLQRHRSFA
ncbi:hypothetical protein BU26DRAFT_42864 [Trematosphaeria pertusa]|uniref:Uncharacterized protein n=1 Tax=Trematosphaeria pertusa TaxID=390896 RepID=A0A6A6J7G9_9PLEO|nr:uncharacterized protein BU26DRAFT_42864 [Trematosphaeria pertusa]KAF2257393.1 hypothetical protein BU26DRAFT_42864 [Trematosphaeria pertusa]